MTGILIEFPARTVVAVMVAVAVVLTAGAALMLRRRGDLTVRRLVLLGVASLYAAGVVALTLPMQIRTGDYANLVPWYDKVSIVPLITIDARTFLLNVLMTMPLGFLLPLLTRVRGVRPVALTGLAVSTAVEILQYLSDVLVSSGRTADVNDLLANTLGAVAGYAVLRTLTRAPAVAAVATRWSLHASTPARPPLQAAHRRVS